MYLSKNLPKISCLMVTANERLSLAKKSIKCFVDQTYPNKELLVINEGSVAYQKDLQYFIDSLNNKNIKTIWLNGKYTLGSLRNISISMSDGEYFVQWDDDDFCMPQRLFSQYSFLTRNKAKVCYFTDQLHYFWSTNTIYWNNWKKRHSGGLKKHSLIPGTGMFHRDIDIRYPSYGERSSAGEDTVFANELLSKNDKEVILFENMGNMHCYTYHGNQVYDLEHHMSISRKRSCNLDFVLRQKERIIDSLNYFKFANSIKVMACEGLAFIYEGGENV